MNGINFNGDLTQTTATTKTTKSELGQLQGIEIAVAQKGGIAKALSDLSSATKKISNQNIETALNEPHPAKAVKGLLEKSPIGLTQMPSLDQIEDMGYGCLIEYHQGSPYNFRSSDGGHISVYEGCDKAGNPLKDGQKKIEYRNGRFIQEMYYDKDGNLIKGSITIKDDVAGFTEAQYDFNVKDNKLKNVIS
ncbi:hypothetical protein HDR58_10650 [bacterium]|nr:hypothetical protein [bacterium]